MFIVEFSKANVMIIGFNIQQNFIKGTWESRYHVDFLSN